MFENRNYMIIACSELNKVDFNSILETSPDTLRYSIDGTKTFVKWDGSDPEFVADLTLAEGPYSHEDILAVLATEEWSSTEPINPDTN